MTEWENELGSSYNELAERILAEKVCESWAVNATRCNSNSFDVLIRYLWEEWTEGEFTIEKTDTNVQIQCTKCPIADSYSSIGKQELG